MASVQVKRVPEDLHAAIKALRSWLDEVSDAHGDQAVREYDVEQLMDGVRGES